MLQIFHLSPSCTLIHKSLQLLWDPLAGLRPGPCWGNSVPQPPMQYSILESSPRPNYAYDPGHFTVAAYRIRRDIGGIASHSRTCRCQGCHLITFPIRDRGLGAELPAFQPTGVRGLILVKLLEFYTCM